MARLTKIQASTARDVVQRRDDDRSNAQRRERGWQAFLATKRLNLHRFTFGAQLKAKSAPKPKVKRERTDATREYFREYQRQRRARVKADA
jgi:hypothetical protein